MASQSSLLMTLILLRLTGLPDDDARRATGAAAAARDAATARDSSALERSKASYAVLISSLSMLQISEDMYKFHSL